MRCGAGEVEGRSTGPLAAACIQTLLVISGLRLEAEWGCWWGAIRRHTESGGGGEELLNGRSNGVIIGWIIPVPGGRSLAGIDKKPSPVIHRQPDYWPTTAEINT